MIGPRSGHGNRMARTCARMVLASLLLATPATPRAETPPAFPAMPAEPQPVVPADPAPDLQVWWVSPEGIALGPYSVEELLALADQGALRPDTPVWREGMKDWQLLGETADLAAVSRLLAEYAAEDADEAARHYLLGTWAGEGAHYPEGVRNYSTSRFDFRANGSFVAVETSLASGLGEQHHVVVLRGKWNVSASGTSQIEILLVHVAEAGEEAKEEIWILDIVDQDTMRDPRYGWNFYRER